MYIPKNFLATDQAEIVAFMQRHSFATIVTAQAGGPVAAHLPFVVTAHRGTVRLASHFARANPQWQEVEAGPVLVIFSEPHAYISPKHYDQALSVPTWNYVAVHAYGQARVISDVARTLDVLETTIFTYEPDYQQQWAQMPAEYKAKMAQGVVAFDITVTDLQAKKKLSQNKSVVEQQRIIAALAQSEDGAARELASYMRQN